MANCQNILVIGELTDGSLSSTTKELLTVGRNLADSLQEDLNVVLLGENLSQYTSDLLFFGTDTIYLAQHSLLENYQDDLYVEAIAQLVASTNPRSILLGKTLIGKELGPRLAFKLGTSLLQDCIHLAIDNNKSLVGKRPIYGGNALAEITHIGTPQLAIVRPKTIEVSVQEQKGKGNINEYVPELSDSMIQAHTIEKVDEPVTGVRLEDARSVVSGGRGLGGPEPFRDLEDLASLLGGATGASRAACDAGWIPSSYQVGLTGKTITPDLYITVGISGASQHMAGCSGAKTIVSINKDSEANIFKDSAFGVVGDWKEVLPGFIDQIKAMTNAS